MEVTGSAVQATENKRKVIVCGGRHFNNENAVNKVLDWIDPAIVVHGDASGADKLAGAWARKNQREERAYPAKWNLHGRAAGPIRNREMLKAENDDELAGVVAFPGGRGTMDMVRLAKETLGEDCVLCIGIK